MTNIETSNAMGCASIPFITSEEIQILRSSHKFIVLLLGKAYDISNLSDSVFDHTSRDLLALRGEDVGHLFSSDLISDVKPSGWKWFLESEWWNDESLVIGRVSRSTQTVKFYNNLTRTSISLRVPCELTLAEIAETRLRGFNSHLSCYVFKFNGKRLDPSKTLYENGISPEAEIILPPDQFEPSTITLYFQDNLSVA